jgi:hypothetical protein
MHCGNLRFSPLLRAAVNVVGGKDDETGMCTGVAKASIRPCWRMTGGTAIDSGVMVRESGRMLPSCRSALWVSVGIVIRLAREEIF